MCYDQPIVLNERQAGLALESVEQHNRAEDRIRISLLAVDTHGVTNVAMAMAKLAQNTSRMDGVVARLSRDGVGIEEDWLRRIGPAHFSHINFRRTLRFNFERYADVLVERAVGRGATKPGQ